MKTTFPSTKIATILFALAGLSPLGVSAEQPAASALRELPTPAEHAMAPSAAVATHESGAGIHTPPASAAPTTYSYAGSAVSHPSTYYILPNMTAQPIYLGPYYNPSTSSGAAWVNYLNPYLSYLLRSPYMSSLSVYGVSTGSARSGLWTSATQPHYSASNPVFLEDASIKSTLTSWLKGGYLQPNDTFVVYTEPGVAVRFNYNNSQTSMNAFLGYHSWFTWVDSRNTTRYATYIVVPFPGYPNYTPASSGYATYGDMVTAVTSHEIGECATDPYAGSYPGWTETIYKVDNTTHQYTVAYSGVSGEIGDAAVILFPSFSQHNCRLNGYLVQKLIARDGVSLITPSGSKAPSGAFEKIAQPILKSFDTHLSVYGLELPLP